MGLSNKKTALRLVAVVASGLTAGSAFAQAGDAGRGKAVYDKYCEQCHGLNGDADGPAAKFMLPRPRPFRDNVVYKFKTAPFDAIPTDQDLYRTIEKGIPGTAMPDFRNLSDQQRWDVVAYIKSMAEDFADKDEIADSKPLPELANPPARPQATADSLKKGKELYEKKAKCHQCHGVNGRGNGESWPTLKDGWGKVPILPANLVNAETYRGGAEAFDIYRTISGGLRGTAMPEYRTAIKPDERWHLVNYVMSMHAQPALDPGEKIVANLVDTLPDGTDDEAWSVAPPARIRTMSNVVEAPRLYWQSVEYVTVQALYTDKRVALRIQWDDRSNSKGSDTKTKYEDRDGKVYINTDHPDQLAVQWPARPPKGNERPYVLMGDNKRPVNLWWWRADKDTAVERNGKGSGALVFQSEDSQQLTHKSSFEDGRYTLVISRALTTLDPKSDVQFIPGEGTSFVPMSFHVWDGRRGELAQRRAFTAWYYLYLKTPVPMSAYASIPITYVITLVLLLGLVHLTRRRAEEEDSADDA